MRQEIRTAVCPHCGKTNQVPGLHNEIGFDEREEFYCDYCGLQIGELNAAEPPVTKYVSDPAVSPAPDEK